MGTEPRGSTVCHFSLARLRCSRPNHVVLAHPLSPCRTLLGQWFSSSHYATFLAHSHLQSIQRSAAFPNMTNGICKLCLEPKPLIRSHLMPRALYDLCRAPDSEPVFVSSELMVQTSRQTQDHLLCEGCDTSLSTNGEDWLFAETGDTQRWIPFIRDPSENAA